MCTCLRVRLGLATRLAASSPPSRLPRLPAMNSFADRFSTTGTAAEQRRIKEYVADDENVSDSMWGSEAGFGTMAHGAPNFMVPTVPDVSSIPGSMLDCF